jgi:hypothetical protein
MTTPHTLNPDVVFKRIGERMVLIHLETNQIFELNNTGARIWEMLEAGTPEDDILERLSAEFEVAPEQLKRDLNDLLRELTSQGLIA